MKGECPLVGVGNMGSPVSTPAKANPVLLGAMIERPAWNQISPVLRRKRQAPEVRLPQAPGQASPQRVEGGGAGEVLVLPPESRWSKPKKKRVENPPTPVEHLDGSPQLGLSSESLIKAEGFWGCHFLGMVCWVSKALYLSSVFGACVLKMCVSPRSLGGGGFPSDAKDVHPRHHQDHLAAMNLSLFSLQIQMVFCCSKRR